MERLRGENGQGQLLWKYLGECFREGVRGYWPCYGNELCRRPYWVYGGFAAAQLVVVHFQHIIMHQRINLQTTQTKVEELLEKSGIFLDIANSPTVYDVNRLALRYKCLRLEVRGISSGDYISEIYMAYPNDFEWLKDFIDYCSQHADSLDQWVAKENFALGYSYD